MRNCSFIQLLIALNNINKITEEVHICSADILSSDKSLLYKLTGLIEFTGIIKES